MALTGRKILHEGDFLGRARLLSCGIALVCPLRRQHPLSRRGYRFLHTHAGTGIRSAGKTLVERGVEQIHLLLSHTHWDPIQGFPYFAPLYEKKTRIQIYSLGRRGHPLEDGFRGQQQPSFFPLSLDEITAELGFTELEDGQRFAIDDTEILCRRMNHPGVTGGFRIEHDGQTFAYLSDLDLYTHLLLGDDLPANSDRERQKYLQRLRDGVRDLAHRTDLMVFDTFGPFS